MTNDAELYDAILKQWENLEAADKSKAVWHVLGGTLLSMPGNPLLDSNGDAIDESLWYEVSAKGTYPLPF